MKKISHLELSVPNCPVMGLCVNFRLLKAVSMMRAGLDTDLTQYCCHSCVPEKL